MTAQPRRLQRRRERGFRLPPGTVCCTRPGRWGNPFYPGGWFKKGDPDPLYSGVLRMIYSRRNIWCPDDLISAPREGYTLINTKREAVEWFRWYAPNIAEEARKHLAGRNLACFCSLCPEHRDGKPFGVTCAACAPCHCDVLGCLANGLACESAP